MSQAGSINLDTAVSPTRLQLQGDWTLQHFDHLRAELERLPASSGQHLDLNQLTHLDTAGAALLGHWLGAERLQQLLAQDAELPPERAALLRTVAEALPEASDAAPARQRTVPDLLANIGASVVGQWKQLRALLAFIGLALESLFLSLWHPRRWRITSLVSHIEQTGLDAIPIIVLLTFMVGAVVAFLGATVLSNFGATIYTVHLVAFSFLREFGVLLTAILMAGRTASAFTAQIGSMKANEEIDAIRVQGLNPMELLVLPRILAMMISLPILTFIAMLSGILGGGLVSALMLDISPTLFLGILQSDIPVQHFLIGLSKAPFFAFVIAIIGCLEGFKSGGSAKSVGDHTTSAVVQSIFMVILLDAVAAMFFMEMGW